MKQRRTSLGTKKVNKQPTGILIHAIHLRYLMLENFVSYAGFEHSLGSSQLPTVSKKESAHVVLSFTLDLAAKSHLENATSQGTGKQPGSNPEQSLHPKSGNKSVGTVSSPAQWEAPGLPTLSSSACKGPNKIVKCPCLYSHHP